MAWRKMVGRFRKEMKEFENCQEKFELHMVNDSIAEMIGKIPGPSKSPYSGGIFEVEIKLRDNYPFDPPKVRFITKVWHPNISSATGAICVDILKDENWSPGMTFKSLLVSLQLLLDSPVPGDPQDFVVGLQMLQDEQMFVDTAKYWTAVYAKGPSRVAECAKKMKSFMDMGVEETKALSALSCNEWNIERASNVLFK